MTRQQLAKYARAQLEELPAVLQGVAVQRAIGSPVIVWSVASVEQLLALIGAVRVVAMLTVEAS